MTGGAFSATTASERLARIHAWLETSPNHEALLQVFKEISARDKGAAKPVKEKIDEHRRQKQQASLADEWSAKAQAMLASSKLNLADAMAWARDAAKAGAPLSREPLAGLRSALADRVAHIESLSHRAQVLRESSLLMAQRIDVLSTKAWTDAVLAQAGLQADLARFDEEWQALGQDPHWPSVDPKFPPMLQEASQHIHLVWDAFGAALTQTQAAANDKLAEWRAKGWNVGICTGDVAENLDAKILVATLETERFGEVYARSVIANAKALADAGLKMQNNKPIRHMVEVLIEDLGYDELKKPVKKPLQDIKIAGYVGCQTNRPFGIAGESFENPLYLDKMVETDGPNRARIVLLKMLERARSHSRLGLSALTSTDYINTIAAEEEEEDRKSTRLNSSHRT